MLSVPIVGKPLCAYFSKLVGRTGGVGIAWGSYPVSICGTDQTCQSNLSSEVDFAIFFFDIVGGDQDDD